MEYTELRMLLSPGGGGALVIGGRLLEPARQVLLERDLAGLEPGAQLDRLLLQLSQQRPEPAPLLCLRCRVSHGIEAWMRGLQRKFGLDLLALASYGLDDDGRLTIRISKGKTVPFVYAELASLPHGLLSPFSAEVLRSYKPELCGLPHWARLRIQGHSGLKAYLKEHGLLLISDWALLNDSSPRRVQESWQAFGQGPWPASDLLQLHKAYTDLYSEAKKSYRARTGKSSGWLPDAGFLEALAPDQAPSTTHEQLRALAKAIRVLVSGSWQRGAQLLERADGSDPIEAIADPASLADGSGDHDGDNPEQLRAWIDGALERATAPHVLAALKRDQPKWAKDPARRLAWELYGQGAGQREIAEQCNHQQGWVSKLLQEKALSAAIATAAAVELARLPVFADVARDPAGAERLVEALRNHLINPEQEGDVAPLRLAIRRLLPTLEP